MYSNQPPNPNAPSSWTSYIEEFWRSRLRPLTMDNLMHCSMCQTHSVSPIYSCIPNAHLVCGLCYDKLKLKLVRAKMTENKNDVNVKCFICRMPLAVNYFVERLSRELDIGVIDGMDSNTLAGCTVTTIGDHLVACKFRPEGCFCKPPPAHSNAKPKSILENLWAHNSQAQTSPISELPDTQMRCSYSFPYPAHSQSIHNLELGVKDALFHQEGSAPMISESEPRCLGQEQRQNGQSNNNISMKKTDVKRTIVSKLVELLRFEQSESECYDDFFNSGPKLTSGSDLNSGSKVSIVSNDELNPGSKLEDSGLNSGSKLEDSGLNSGSKSKLDNVDLNFNSGSKLDNDGINFNSGSKLDKADLNPGYKLDKADFNPGCKLTNDINSKLHNDGLNASQVAECMFKRSSTKSGNINLEATTTTNRKKKATTLYMSNNNIRLDDESTNRPDAESKESLISNNDLHEFQRGCIMPNTELMMNLDACSSDGIIDDPKIALVDHDLWTQFNDLTTEMIITKAGRYMFPPIKFRMKGLDPQSMYIVLLDIVPADHLRYKYEAGLNKWLPFGLGDTEMSKKMYIHPQSPASGEYLMRNIMSYQNIKLTNTESSIHPCSIALNSMHKYQPRLHLVRESDIEKIPYHAFCTFVFKVTEFMAVTAYQNEEITGLKIQKNPFAKGFRERRERKRNNKPPSNPSLVSSTMAVGLGMNQEGLDYTIKNQISKISADGTIYQTKKFDKGKGESSNDLLYSESVLPTHGLALMTTSEISIPAPLIMNHFLQLQLQAMYPKELLLLQPGIFTDTTTSADNENGYGRTSPTTDEGMMKTENRNGSTHHFDESDSTDDQKAMKRRNETMADKKMCQTKKTKL